MSVTYTSLNPIPKASYPIELVATATANGTSLIVPAHRPTDLIVFFAFRGGNATPPTLPTGFANGVSGHGTTCSGIVGYTWGSTISGDASGTWTNASELICHIYRPPSGGYTLGIGNFAQANSITSTVTYPAVSFADTDGKSLGVAFTGVNNLTETVNTPPTGMTNQSSVAGATYAAAGFDTGTGVTGWSSQTVTTTGTVGNSLTFVFELMALPFDTTFQFIPQLCQHVGGGSNPPTAGNYPQIGNNYKIPLQNPVGANNCLVLSLSFQNPQTVKSITDTQGNPWSNVAVAYANAGAGQLDTGIYVLPNAIGGQTTINVTFSSATINAFTYSVSEFYNVALASPVNNTAITANASGPIIGSGNITQSSGNGSIIWNSVVKCSGTGVATTMASRVRASNSSFSLLDADIGWMNLDGMFKGTQSIILPSGSPAANCKMSFPGDKDQYNSVAIALTLNPTVGTAPNTTFINPRTVHHFTTDKYPAGVGSYVLQVPSRGNLRLLMCDDPNINIKKVYDSEGNIWVNDGGSGGGGAGFFYRANCRPNEHLQVNIQTSGGDTGLSWRYYDLIAADPNPFDSFIISGQTVSSVTSFTVSPSPSPSGNKGIAIMNIGLGQGPGLAITSPAGGVFTLCTYTSEQDTDQMENADLTGHFLYNTSGAQTWTLAITSRAGNSTSGGIICFKSI